ncbi:hypothetical protein chiPu_0024755 [Chiloscyllium punctatum]|uniref:Uncharacterized protein n=1 Tax=Chiloscyllium punctatum TaxID=137246 RepID=A0A401TDT6_CHIPU|nr:hypothetical protein [Chiloscyllium punctatum]
MTATVPLLGRSWLQAGGKRDTASSFAIHPVPRAREYGRACPSSTPATISVLGKAGLLFWLTALPILPR